MSPPSPPPKTLLVVFDFDWSFIDEDSDLWTCRMLPKLFKQMEADLNAENTTGLPVPWTDRIAEFMVRLHGVGKTREEIEDNLKTIPFSPAMKRGVESLKSGAAPETTFFCLSNANVVFIRLILEHHNLGSLFNEVVSNPAEWTPEGCLVIRRRVPPEGVQHGCDAKPRACSANMCKGKELDAFIQRRGGWRAFDRVAYVGDGSNDLCPLLRLRPQDFGLVRSGRELARLYPAANPTCSVEEWAEATELEKIFGKIAEEGK